MEMIIGSHHIMICRVSLLIQRGQAPVVFEFKIKKSSHPNHTCSGPNLTNEFN